MFTLRY